MECVITIGHSSREGLAGDRIWGHREQRLENKGGVCGGGRMATVPEVLALLRWRGDFRRADRKTRSPFIL